MSGLQLVLFGLAVIFDFDHARGARLANPARGVDLLVVRLEIGAKHSADRAVVQHAQP